MVYPVEVNRKLGERLGLGRFGWGGCRDPAASANAETVADDSRRAFVDLSIEAIRVPNLRKQLIWRSFLGLFTKH